MATPYSNCDCNGIHINGDLGDSGGPPGLVQNALIENNVIYRQWSRSGISADGLQNSTIENNLIYNYANYGICLYQIDAVADQQNNIIVNNTIDSAHPTGGGSMRILDGSTGNTILNNILLDGSSIVVSNLRR